MKKILLSILSVIILSFNAASFAVSSVSEAQDAVQKINGLAQTDFNSFVISGELIGNKKDDFNMHSAKYKKFLNSSAQSIYSLLGDIAIAKNSPDIPSSEKNARINKAYSDIDAILYNVDNETVAYVGALRYVMPGLTYKKFKKKFANYYNSLGINSTTTVQE